MTPYFYWDVRVTWSANASPAVRRVTFGNGYEQRQQDGINSNLKVYQCEITNRKELVDDVDNFFDERKSVEAFMWRSPKDYIERLVVCDSWNVANIDGANSTISFSLREVAA